VSHPCSTPRILTSDHPAVLPRDAPNQHNVATVTADRFRSPKKHSPEKRRRRWREPGP
jgi:hypothetical protein